MRTATTIEASAGREAVEFAVEAEKLGLEVCWVAEAWGADAPSPLGYLAARTERVPTWITPEPSSMVSVRAAR